MENKKQKGYVDGFVLRVPKDKVAEYRQMAEGAAKVWKKYGALDYKECVGEDLYPKAMEGAETLSFVDLTKAEADETIWFSFITYKSREHRDEVNAKVMAEMMKDPKNKEMAMPFEMKKMAYGGFEVMVDA
jgi:uncharacterized protein YbaA (DUF1428 family)